MIEICIAAFLVVVVFVLTVYYYGYRDLGYFEKHGIPYIPPLPFLGNMAPIVFRKKTLDEVIERIYNHDRDAKYVGYFDFSRPVVILRDPELIKSVTIKNFEQFPDHRMMAEEIPDPIFKNNLFGLQGQRWRDTRALLSPSFTSSKMKILFKLMKECTANLILYMKTETEKSTVFEMRDILTRYTNDVIATSAFGIGVDSLKDRENEIYLMGKKSVDFSGARSLRLFILRMFPRLAELLGVNVFGEDTANFYKNIVKTTIATRDAEGIVRPDMLQLMMQTRDSSKNNIQKMTDDDMAPHAFIFYFGGFDTAAIIMCFTVHKITVNPQVHEKLQAEVDEVWERCNGDVTYEALHAMEYLDAVVNEVLRLHTPATVIDRLCRKKFELPPAKPGLKPFTIEPGYTVMIAPVAIQTDPKYFSNPDKFDPERFIGPGKNDIDPATFIPFGIGPRICIGNRFALMEVKLVIFELLVNFKLKTCNKTVDPLKLNRASFVPMIEGGVWIQLERRNR